MSIKDVVKKLKSVKKSVEVKVPKKAYKHKLKSKKIIKKGKPVTVYLDQPVYTKDKARYYRENWKTEEKELFFK